MSDDNNTEESAAAEDDWAAAMEEQGDAEANPAETNVEKVEQVAMEDLVPEETTTDSNVQLESLLDIPVVLSVRIGQTKVNIRNLLQLNQGSVVELDRLAGEPLDVLVNNTLVAHGEIVVVNEKYGIRLTDVVSAHERVKNLQ